MGPTGGAAQAIGPTPVRLPQNRILGCICQANPSNRRHASTGPQLPEFPNPPIPKSPNREFPNWQFPQSCQT